MVAIIGKMFKLDKSNTRKKTTAGQWAVVSSYAKNASDKMEANLEVYQDEEDARAVAAGLSATAAAGGEELGAAEAAKVAECRGRRLQLFSLLTGEPLQLIRLGDVGKPPVLRAVCCDGDSEEGRAYVSDFANHRVAVLKLRAP